MSDKLHKLRDAIDQIDAEILQLIAHRMTLSDEVIAAKNGEAAFRPGREAALVRRLAAMESDMAPAVLLGIWRQIMAASLTRQNKDLTFAVHQAALTAAIWHMGSALTAGIVMILIRCWPCLIRPVVVMGLYRQQKMTPRWQKPSAPSRKSISWRAPVISHSNSDASLYFG